MSSWRRDRMLSTSSHMNPTPLLLMSTQNTMSATDGPYRAQVAIVLQFDNYARTRVITCNRLGSRSQPATSQPISARPGDTG